MGEEKSVVELREIYSCLVLSTNTAAKGIITLCLSSGMSRDTILRLTIKDLLFACKYYNIEAYSEEEQSKCLNRLLHRNPDKIIPMWIYETEKEYYVTFSSPESLFYIFLHLKQRLVKDSLKITDKLFKIGSSTLTDNLQISRDITRMGSYYPYYDENEVVSHNFTVTTLQKFFERQCINQLPDHNEHKKRTFNTVKYGEHKAKVLTLFMNGIPKEDSFYDYVRLNPADLLIEYQKVLPYVTAKNYDKIRPSWFAEDDLTKYVNARIKEERESSKKRTYNQLEVSNIISSYANIKLKDVDLNNFNITDLIDLALKENDHGFFNESNEYLDTLLVKLSLKKDLEANITDKIEIFPLGNEEIDEVISKLNEAEILEFYNINEEFLVMNIQDYISPLKNSGKREFLTLDDILEICFATMLE